MIPQMTRFGYSTGNMLWPKRQSIKMPVNTFILEEKSLKEDVLRWRTNLLIYLQRNVNFY